MLAVALSRLGRWRECPRTKARLPSDWTRPSPYVFYAQCAGPDPHRTHRAGAAGHREAIRLDSDQSRVFRDSRCPACSISSSGIGPWPRSIRHWRSSLVTSAVLNLRSRTLLQLGRREEAERTAQIGLGGRAGECRRPSRQGKMLLTRAQATKRSTICWKPAGSTRWRGNDSGSIAMAVGWQLIPFRWISRKAAPLALVAGQTDLGAVHRAAVGRGALADLVSPGVGATADRGSVRHDHCQRRARSANARRAGHGGGSDRSSPVSRVALGKARCPS